MKISVEECAVLFDGKPFLADPSTMVLVVFPHAYKPKPEELTFLKTMFGAMHWPIWEIRYFVSDKKELESEFRDIPFFLFFGFDGSHNIEVMVIEKGESIHFFFPEINQFQSNHALKTLVWKALKPYARQSKS